jgi:hypothetical protein
LVFQLEAAVVRADGNLEVIHTAKVDGLSALTAKG